MSLPTERECSMNVNMIVLDYFVVQLEGVMTDNLLING